MSHVLADVLETARRVARDVAARESFAVDRDARWPAAAMRSLQQEGLGGLVIPTVHGGMGQGLLGLAHVCETLARACPSTAICFGMHQVASAVIASRPTRDQVDRYLSPIIAGEHLTTLALSEPGTGVHFYFPQTQMRREDGMYLMDGTKSFVTNGGHADSYVLSVQSAEDEVRPGEFSCVMAPAEARGMAWGPRWDGLGLRGNSSRTLTLQDVRVPRADRLGAEGDQTWYVFQVVAPYFLVAMAGTYLGIGARALEEAIASVGARRLAHDDSGLRDVALLQHRIGALWTRLQRTRRLVYWAAAEADAGGADAVPALCAAKADVAECVNRVVGDCMTLAGGRAYQQGALLGQLLRDARAAHVMAPTTDILLTWTGRALLGLPLVEESATPSP